LKDYRAADTINYVLVYACVCGCATHCVYVCVCVYVFMCGCVCEREREREEGGRLREGGKEGEQWRNKYEIKMGWLETESSTDDIILVCYFDVPGEFDS